jgi:Flp pilus assembly protein TadD
MAGSEVRNLAASGAAQTSRPVALDQIVLVLGLALTFVAYCGSIGYQFVSDDHAQILTNAFVHSWRFARYYFTQQVWESVTPGVVSNHYRPMFILWLRINHMLFGLHPWGWHLSNILVHLGATLSVYFLAARVIGDRLTAAFAATIFGLHPVHVEGVVWVSGVTEPLLGVLLIPSFICYLKRREGRDRGPEWLASSLLLYLGALFAKETALMLPLIIFAYGWLDPYSGEGQSTPSRAAVTRLGGAAREALPYVAVTPIYLIFRVMALKGFSHTLTPLALRVRLLTVPSLLWFYLKRLFWPVGMSLNYDLPYISEPTPLSVFLPATAIAALALVVWAWARRLNNGRPMTGMSNGCLVAFAAVWTMAPLLPVLDVSMFPPNDHVHDRYLYLSSAGFAIAAAVALRGIKMGSARFWGQTGFQLGLGFVVAMLFVWGTLVESVAWSNNLLLFYRAAKSAPHNARLKSNLAGALADRGYHAQAIALLREVLTGDPGLWEANYNLGVIYYQLGKLDDAAFYLKQATSVNPVEPTGLVYLGLTELRMGRSDEAAAVFHQAIRVNPNVYGVHFARGMVFKIQGDLRGALEEFDQELALNPKQQAVLEQITAIQGSSGRPASETSVPRKP